METKKFYLLFAVENSGFLCGFEKLRALAFSSFLEALDAFETYTKQYTSRPAFFAIGRISDNICLKSSVICNGSPVAGEYWNTRRERFAATISRVNAQINF